MVYLASGGGTFDVILVPDALVSCLVSFLLMYCFCPCQFPFPVLSDSFVVCSCGHVSLCRIGEIDQVVSMVEASTSIEI